MEGELDWRATDFVFVINADVEYASMSMGDVTTTELSVVRTILPQLYS